MIGSLFRLAFVIIGWLLFLPILADAATCTVTAGFADPAAEVSGLLVDVAHDHAVHGPVGSGDAVECAGLVEI